MSDNISISQDQPIEALKGTKRLYRCNSVIVCMARLNAFETPQEEAYCSKHHIPEALEEIYPTKREEDASQGKQKKFHLIPTKYRKSPSRGHGYATCECGICERFRIFLGAMEKQGKCGLMMHFLIRRQFGVKLQRKDGMVYGSTESSEGTTRAGSVSQSE